MRTPYPVTGQKIMDVLLDQSGATWDELVAFVGATNDGYVQMLLYNHLWALCRANLVRIDGVPDEDTLSSML